MSTAISWHDMRILGAIQVRSGITQAALADHVEVQGEKIRVIRNKSQLYVITQARGFETFSQNFVSQANTPPPGVENTFSLTISDPRGRWLPRIMTVILPRDATANPASARQQPNSLFQPIHADLLPASTADIAPWWAIIRAHVQHQVNGSMQAVRGALLRVRAAPDTSPHDGIADGAPANDAPVLGYGLSDVRGEALIAIPALPAHTFANSIIGNRAVDDGDDDDQTANAPVVTFDTPCVLDAVADSNASWPLDYQTLTTRFNDNTLLRSSLSLSLHAGIRHHLTLTLTP